MKRLHIPQVVFLILCLVLPTLLFAQPGFEEEIDDVPLDGGLSILMAAGAIYGAKRFRKK